MGVKKSQLYSSLWQSCDELRGGMDASQYKDYVLVMLFVKYVSDRFRDNPFGAIKVPKGSSFDDMVELKGDPHIGDKLNKLVLGPLFKANNLPAPPDFNDATKLGDGKEMVQRLTNLIAIFESPELDFSKNRADGDDLLGDAYEYLMRHFATESGKSKGQFYTPAEVSRVMAQVLGIREADTSRMTTVYDPTCGSGSLLLKVGSAARTQVSLYGQEKDVATASLARMNLILHNQPTAEIRQGNTLANPLFLEGGSLKTFDFVVANPPFSDKRWSTGIDPHHDAHGRFKHFGVPPGKQGDYAYLLHIVRSLRSAGKGACILPHGVLFRGNAEAEIRRNLIKRGLIKGIIGLPANLFYGTGIPACIVVIDKEGAASRDAIFMVDASKGFIKDGNKNRLREMDIHRIVDVFTRQSQDDPRYARLVPRDEIERNEFNLNIPRYIDSQEAEDIQDIDGHLRGGIPARDLDDLGRYWAVCPGLRGTLFAERRPGYVDLTVEKGQLKTAIFEHPEFAAFTSGMETLFDAWRSTVAVKLKALGTGFHPKELIAELGEGLLAHYEGKPLVDHYAVYQHLMDYWAETMQDDAYLVSSDGWKAETTRIIVTDKKGNEKDKGWECDLVPKELIVRRYFQAEASDIEALKSALETAIASRTALEDEHGTDEGALAQVGNKTEANAARVEAVEAVWSESEPALYQKYQAAVQEYDQQAAQLRDLKNEPALDALKNQRGTLTLKAVRGRLKAAPTDDERRTLERYLEVYSAESKAKKRVRSLYDLGASQVAEMLASNGDADGLEDIRIIDEWLALFDEISETKSSISAAAAELDAKAYAKYPALTQVEVKELVVDDKWLATLSRLIQGELDRITQTLSNRVNGLVHRYDTPLPRAAALVADLQANVDAHLKRMGFTWT